MPEQLVGLLLGGLAVVACHRDLDIPWNDRAAGVFEAGQHALGNMRSVRALALGHGEGDGGRYSPGRRLDREPFFGGRRSLAEKDVLIGFGRPVRHLGHVPHVHRPALVDPQYHRRYLFAGVQQSTGVHDDLTIARRSAARIRRLIGCQQNVHDPGRVDPVGRQPHGIEAHLQPARLAADQLGDGCVRLAFDEGFGLCRHPSQGVMVQVFTPEGERQDGHVVDVTRLDQRRCDAAGDAVHVGHELGLQPHDGLLFILTHVKPDDGHGHARAGGGVDVFHARDLPKQFFHGQGDALLDLLGLGARHLDEDVDHRDDDLGFLLARQGHDGSKPHQHRRDDNQRRQLGVDESPCDPSGGSELRRGHEDVSTREPSMSPGGGSTTKRLPSARPEITSTRSPRRRPVRTRRKRAMPSAVTR